MSRISPQGREALRKLVRLLARLEVQKIFEERRARTASLTTKVPAPRSRKKPRTS